MAKLNYLGIDPNSDAQNPNNEFIPLTTTSCKGIIDAFPTTRIITNALLQEGWTGPGGFTGTNNYLATSSNNSQQKTLQNLLSYKNNVLNPCVQSSAVLTETSKYISNSQRGAANGVASTDANNKVPLEQLPSMGSGYLLGPFGTSWIGSGTASSIANGPLKFAEWAIQTNAINFYPHAYMIINTQTDSHLGRPVIEVRLSNGPATTYSNLHPLIAMGTGRSYYTGIQTIAVLPCPRVNGQVGGSFYSPSYNTYLTAWLYDSGNGNTSIGSAASSVIVASAFLMRVLAT